MLQCIGSALVQVMMVCRLFSAKPLTEPMLAYCQFDSWEQISVKLESEFYNFHSRKRIWNCRLPKWRPFCPGGDELMHWLLNKDGGSWQRAFSNICNTLYQNANIFFQQNANAFCWKNIFTFWYEYCSNWFLRIQLATSYKSSLV